MKVSEFRKFISDVVREAIQESEASEEAKKLNLVHVGFGNYAKKIGGSIMYKTIDGKLVYVGKPEPAKDPKIIKKPEGDPAARSEFDPEHPEYVPPAKIQKVGVTDVELEDEDKQIYTFRYNGRLGRIKLSKEEIEQLEVENIVHIIEARIKRKIARLKGEKEKEKEQPKVPVEPKPEPPQPEKAPDDETN